MKFFKFMVFAAAFSLALFGSDALAAPATYTPFGDAELTAGHNSPNGYQLRSDADPGWGGVDFAVEPGLTFGDYSTLSFDYKFTDGSCSNGSPRFVFSVKDATTGNEAYILSYLGDYPNFTNCQAGTWLNSGNLLASDKTFDAPGGVYYDTYSDVMNTYGGYEVIGMWIVADAGSVFPTTGQTVVVDNVMINNRTFTFETANSCKNGGYVDFTSAPGPFTNQGACVSYFARGGQ